MVAAGAADGDSDIGAIAGGEPRQPLVQEAEDILIHLLDVGLPGQVLGDGRLQTRMVAQLWLPVGVGQATHIEHQIGIHGHATLEAEGFDQESGAGLRLVQQAQLDGVAQLVKVEVRGVDLQVGEIGDGRQQQLLVLDGFCQGAVVIGQRMAPARLGKTLEQGVVLGIEVEHVALDMAAAGFIQQFGEA
ncbi:hypothetical protein D9M69_460340 [compost metagenome]